MVKDSFADGIIKNRHHIIELGISTEETDISDNFDWIEFVGYPNDNKPIYINTLKEYDISIKWTKLKFTAKYCKCILFEKLRRTLSKRFIKDIKKYYGMTPKEYILSFPSILKYKLRFEFDKKYTTFSKKVEGKKW